MVKSTIGIIYADASWFICIYASSHGAAWLNLVICLLLWNLQAVPLTLLALVLSFDHRKTKDVAARSDMSPSRKWLKYVWYALISYVVGFVIASLLGILITPVSPGRLLVLPGHTISGVYTFLSFAYGAMLSWIMPICKHRALLYQLPLETYIWCQYCLFFFFWTCDVRPHVAKDIQGIVK